MKTDVTFHFDLPEEKQERDDMFQGADWHAVVIGVDEYLRSKVKYGGLPEPVEAALAAARTYLLQQVLDRNLVLHD